MRDGPSIEDLAALGALLRALRLAAGLTQEALAERSGVGTRSIQGFERGERRPHRETTRRLSEALDLSESDRARLEESARIAPRERRLLRLVPAPRRTQAGPDRSWDVPLPLTSFVGRETQLGRLNQSLGSTRLLTLTGPPGIGKTRLALEAARTQSDNFDDGVLFLPLATIREPERVVSAIAEAIGLEGVSRRPLVDQVAASLRDRRCLLVLDNFEQVVAAAPLLSRILEACPRVAMLITSRTRLAVRGERELAVLPLTLPDVDQIDENDANAISQVAHSEAGRLFAERARDARPDFAITLENARCIAQICRRLDGLPLAIELAAPWVRAFSLPILLARLSHRLALLTTGPADLPVRQQTLRNAIAWSYDLLTAELQALFRRLAVFSGGFSLPAAEEIAVASAADLASLLDKSLIYRVGGEPTENVAEPRFALLETIREFGLDCLATDGELASVSHRHFEYFLARAEEAEPELTGPRMDAWLERLETEHDNFRAALRWAIEAQSAEPHGLRLAVALWRFWEIRAHFSEGRRWLELALERGSVTPAQRAKALVALCNAAADQGDVAAAQLFGEQGLARCRELGDTDGVEWSLVSLGDVALKRGDLGAARLLFEEAVPIARELGNKTNISYLLAQRGEVARRMGHLSLARALCEESLAIRREVGDAWSIGLSLRRLARVAMDQGDLAGARALVEEAIPIGRGLQDRRSIAWTLNSSGDIARAAGDLARARALYEESRLGLRAATVQYEFTRVLTSLGDVARQQGDLSAARVFCQESMAVARELGYPDGVAAALATLGLVAIRDGDLDAARARLDESLRLYATTGDTLKVVELIEAHAALAAAQGRPDRATTLWGAAEVWRSAHGAPLILEASSRESQLCAARPVLGETGVAEAWSVGQRLTLDQAISCALGADDLAD